MKTITFIVIILIVTAFALATFSSGDPNYGKLPGFMLAVLFSALLVFPYLLTYGIIRKDVYILSAVVVVLLVTTLTIIKISADSNSFGIFWGGIIVITLFGIPLSVFGVSRIIYKSTRKTPSANKNSEPTR